MRTALLTLLVCAGLAAQPPRAAWAAPAAAPALVADGPVWVDARSGLAWSRCDGGLQWDGRRCTGDTLLFTHAEALAFARERSRADGVTWRVPRLQELRRLGEQLGARAAGAGASTTPAALEGWYWTSTVRIESHAVNPYAYDSAERGSTETRSRTLPLNVGWAIAPQTGEVRDMPKRERLPVRLVRALAP